MKLLHNRPGEIRKLTDEEKRIPLIEKYGFQWVVTRPFEATVQTAIGETRIVYVPLGFLCDGNSGGPDDMFGKDWWVYHDLLYATHEWLGPLDCTRQQADDLMDEFIRNEAPEALKKKCSCAGLVIELIADIDPWGLFSKAWEESGKRGALFLRPQTGEVENEVGQVIGM